MRASASSVRSTTSSSASSPGATGSCPAARSAPWSFEPNSRSGQSSAYAAPCARAHCARRRLNSWRTDSGRPHIWTTSTRPERASRSASSPSIPSRVEQRERAAHGLGRRGVAEGVRGAQAPVPVVLRVRHGVDLHEQAWRPRCSGPRRRSGGPSPDASSPAGASRSLPGSRRRAPRPERYCAGSMRIARASWSPSACSRPFARTVSGPPNGSRPASSSSSPGAMPRSDR